MAMLGAALAWGTAGVASAATQSVPPPVAPGSPPGGFTEVVTTETVPTTGGAVEAAVNGAEVGVDIPPGAFPEPVDVTLTAPDIDDIKAPSCGEVVAGVGVGISAHGEKFRGMFLRPVTVTISSPRIHPSDTVAMWNGSAWVTDTGATVTAGMASIVMDRDGAFIVETPPACAPEVPGATTPVTGEPFLGVGILAGLLVLGGTGAIFASRRRRAKSAPAGPAQG
jgi:hypothetical protein